VASDLPSLEVDPERMAQVFGNIVDNALRYTPAGGTIELTARRFGSDVELAVKDSGPGVDAEELKHMFDRFYRGDKSRQREDGGTGLGLAIAKSIVEAHGGRIRAESPPGEGLMIVITLPVVATAET
jgi:signal transduction histidine kinase